jgi:hypothetical protein
MLNPDCNLLQCRVHIIKRKYFNKKRQWRPPGKKKKGEKTVSPRNRRACHNINVAIHVIILLQEKAVERTSQTKIKDEKTKSEEKEGMPQHKHCPLAKSHEDKNSNHHEMEHKDVA